MSLSLREEVKREILMRYARLSYHKRYRADRPEVCRPSPNRRDKDGGPQGARVMFPDREAAGAAAGELSALFGVTYRVYECPRSRNGHCHLSDVSQYHATGGADGRTR